MRVRWAPWQIAGPPGAATVGARRSVALLDRFALPTDSRAFWAALWVAVAAAEFVALIPVALGTGEPMPGWLTVSRMIGGSFAACGLVAWRRRPDSRIGPLMTATGFALFFWPVL